MKLSWYWKANNAFKDGYMDTGMWTEASPKRTLHSSVRMIKQEQLEHKISNYEHLTLSKSVKNLDPRRLLINGRECTMCLKKLECIS